MLFVDKMGGRKSPSEVERIARFDPEDVLNRLKPGKSKSSWCRVESDSTRIPGSMSSVLVREFRKSRECAGCGIIGNVMFLEKTPNLKSGKTPYINFFNLYAETKRLGDDEERFILMTIDHIIPRRSGGSEDPSNLQVMCALCNMLKDWLNIDASGIRKSLSLIIKIADASRFNRRQRKLSKEFRHLLMQIGRRLDRLADNLPEEMLAERREIESGYFNLLGKVQSTGEPESCEDYIDRLKKLSREAVVASALPKKSEA